MHFFMAEMHRVYHHGRVPNDSGFTKSPWLIDSLIVFRCALGLRGTR